MATVTGLTATRMQQIIDQQVAAGAIDLSGNLIFTRNDGSTFNAGQAKGPRGDPAIYQIGSFDNMALVNYVRLGVIDGVNVQNGGAMQFLLSNVGGIGNTKRATVLVHATQRGENVIDIRAWSWGLHGGVGIDALRLYTRQLGPYLFEVWARYAPYTFSSVLSLLGSWRSTLTIDQKSSVEPTSLVEWPIERSDSPEASSVSPGMIEIATNAEALAGVDSVRAIVPASLKYVIDPLRTVQHAEFSGSVTVPEGTVHPFPVLPMLSEYTTDASIATPTSGGFNVPAGLFLIDVSVRVIITPVSALVRSFVDISDSISGLSHRMNGVQGSEDKYTGNSQMYMPSSGKISLSIYQTSSGARSVELRVKITKVK